MTYHCEIIEFDYKTIQNIEFFSFLFETMVLVQEFIDCAIKLSCNKNKSINKIVS